MDSLVGSFSSSFSVSSEPNDTAAPHPRMGQYKKKTDNIADQETRRRRTLEQQKRKRLDFANYSRKLADGDLTEDDIANGCEEMESESYKERRKRFNPYAYQLMLSEWLVDIPDDLAKEWLMVVCPFGRRNLIIASNGKTSVYTKSGFRVNQFTSLLPCGSPGTLKPGEYTILDCIFNEIDNTFYVLDVMCWRGHPVFDSETEFRFYWLQTKLEEDPRLSKISSLNPYKFEILKYYPCTTQEIKSAVETPSSFEVDGLLFYHKRAHYLPGRTPLVGWLKMYMLSEILNIPIDPELTAKAPRVNKMTLMKNNLDLKDTTDDKTPEERAEAEYYKATLYKEAMDVERQKTNQNGGQENNKDVDSVLSEDETAAMEVTLGKSSRRRRKRNKKDKQMETN